MAILPRAFGIRLLTALVILPLAALLVWAPSLRFLFAVFVSTFAAVGLYEYYALARRCQIAPETVAGIIAGTLVAFSGRYHSLPLMALTLCVACIAIATVQILRGTQSPAGLAATIFGVIYVGWFSGHMLLLQGIPQIGAGLVTMLILAIAVTDAVAYLGGSTFGRNKMAPSLSPNKTWEGAVCGFAATVAAMALFYVLSHAQSRIPFPAWSLVRYLMTGAVLSAVAQAGDLVESGMKRSAGVKDAGAVFPGHGGVLDRCDGYLFATPVLYYMVTGF
jgi:phosphatidate cytidylyltransferase